MLSSLRRAAYLQGQRLLGSKIGDAYREFLDLETRPQQELEDLAAERLQRLLLHATRTVPYYQARVRADRNLTLTDFPILTKDSIRAHYRELMTPETLQEETNGPKKGYGTVRVRTGGTTGVPTTVIHGPRFRDLGRAARMYSQRLCGFDFGTPYFRLWGSMADINQMADSRAQRLTRMLAQEILLNAFRMDDDTMAAYLERLNASSVDHLMAYVDCAEQLARYAEKRGTAMRPLKSIMACAGTVTEEARRRLSHVFGATVHNKYGSRDCAEMACECSRGGLHIYSNLHLIEVVDEAGNRLPPGQHGRLLVTLLENTEFPLIRYEIGDVGALRAGQCACGSPFPLLEEVAGRTSEFLLTADGAYISPVYVRHLIGVVHNPGIVRRFQLVQETPTVYALSLELEAGTPEEIYSRVRTDIHRDLHVLLGAGSELTITRQDQIAESASGKFSYTISRVSKRRAAPGGGVS